MSATRREFDTNHLSGITSSKEGHISYVPIEPINPLDDVVLLETQIAILEKNFSQEHRHTQTYLDDSELFQFQESTRANNSLKYPMKEKPSPDNIQRYRDDEQRLLRIRLELKSLISPDINTVPQNRVNEYYRYGRDGRVKHSNGKPEVAMISIEHEDKSYLVDVYGSQDYNDPENGIIGKVWFVSDTTRDGERNPMGELNLEGFQQGERIIYGKYSNELFNIASIGDNSLELLDSYSLAQVGKTAQGIAAD